MIISVDGNYLQACQITNTYQMGIFASGQGQGNDPHANEILISVCVSLSSTEVLFSPGVRMVVGYQSVWI